MNDDEVWFEPKLFGYGAGLPIRWQGWALIGGYLAMLAVASMLLRERHPGLFVAVALLSTVPLMTVAAQHTRGGWRWRWGRE